MPQCLRFAKRVGVCDGAMLSLCLLYRSWKFPLREREMSAFTSFSPCFGCQDEYCFSLSRLCFAFPGVFIATARSVCCLCSCFFLAPQFCSVCFVTGSTLCFFCLLCLLVVFWTRRVLLRRLAVVPNLFLRQVFACSYRFVAAISPYLSSVCCFPELF